jgi:hypothetical protein
MLPFPLAKGLNGEDKVNALRKVASTEVKLA